uniref:DUF1868 domain-containing protein n=1 Tax=Chromera velia CCMP2878 TaxID=1169474 RepID=A0A0G4GP98_9ALVE|eukprot:Cvel_22772.t1-p1 / transcript=Cvel_22772.t1 / gene=Cvel_22772 / organism=Chromera_velia_CCMP2878 / gene_product=hypothetical protein / transcript_product=hypothetical protein / location=Cvel_scaffold2276:1370-2482(-) / protein_length=371 / sequence_SO=supercontig / SO=protein_coding / is_pseudo=false
MAGRKEDSVCVILRASGGEFRVVISNANPETETRGNSLGVCFVVGQNGNTRSAIGLGNPWVNPPFTTDAPQSLASGSSEEKTFWFGLDRQTGWVFMGTLNDQNPRPCVDNILLSARIGNGKLFRWKFVGFSNWIDPVRMSVLSISRLPLIMHLSSNKFDSMGNTIQCEGVTVVSHHGRDHPLHQRMLMMQKMIESHPLLAPHYALLPPPSFHVTTLDLISFVSETFLSDPQGFEQRLHTTASRAYACASHLKPEILVFRPVSVNGKACSVTLEPDDQTRQQLSAWRASIEENCRDLGVRLDPDYRFHSTFAYQLYRPTSKEARKAFRALKETFDLLASTLGEVRLQGNDICRFHDMAAFHVMSPETLAQAG